MKFLLLDRALNRNVTQAKISLLPTVWFDASLRLRCPGLNAALVNKARSFYVE